MAKLHDNSKGTISMNLSKWIASMLGLLFCMAAQSQTVNFCSLALQDGTRYNNTSGDYPGMTGSASAFCIQQLARGNNGYNTNGACAHQIHILAVTEHISATCNPDPFAWPSSSGICSLGVCEVCSDGSCASVATWTGSYYNGGAAMCVSFPGDTSPICHSDAPAYVVRQMKTTQQIFTLGGPPALYTLYADGQTNGTLGSVPVNDSSPELNATTTQSITVRSSPVVAIQNGGYTYVEFMQGYAVDDLGNEQDVTWTYEQSCGRGCRLNGSMHATFAISAGRKYKFFLNGQMIVPNGADQPQYTMQAY